MLSHTTKVWLTIICRTLQGAMALFVLYFFSIIFVPFFYSWKENYLWNEVSPWNQQQWINTNPKSRLDNPRFHMRKSIPLRAGMDQEELTALLGEKGAYPSSYDISSLMKEETGLIPNANRKLVAYKIAYPLGEDDDTYSSTRYDFIVGFDNNHRLVDAHTSFLEEDFRDRMN